MKYTAYMSNMIADNICIRYVIIIIYLLLLYIGNASATTLTVDVSGGADFLRIQDAIDASSDGDTILVYSGSYFENVNVSKQLMLRGFDNGNGKPVVNANGKDSAIKLGTGWSTIEGFNITNGKRNAKCHGIGGGGGLFDRNCLEGISVTSSNNIIRNNTVSNTDEGIYLYSSHNNTLSENIVQNNNNGIVLAGSKNNILSGNIARNNNNGIFLSNSDTNTLSSNDVSNNEGIAFFLISSSYNKLNNNDINSNKGVRTGITTVTYSVIGAGIHIQEYSKNNRIYNNNIINNQVSGNPDDLWDGNYWNDYKGIDANHDGIGDTPYIINNSTKDNYPLIVPYRELSPLLNPIPTSIVPPSAEDSYLDDPCGLNGCGDIYENSYDYGQVWSNKEDDTVDVISISGDGSYIAAASSKGFYFFNRKGKLIWNRKTNGRVMELSVSSDGSYIGVNILDNFILFNKEGNIVWEYKWSEPHKNYNYNRHISFSSDSSYIAASNNMNVNFFNREGKLLWNYSVAEEQIEGVYPSWDSPFIGGVSVSSDGSFIAVASNYRNKNEGRSKVDLLNKEGKLLRKIDDSGRDGDVAVLSDGSLAAHGFFFNNEGKRLTTQGRDGKYFSLNNSYAEGLTFYSREGNKLGEANILWNAPKDYRFFRDFSVSSDGLYIAAIAHVSNGEKMSDSITLFSKSYASAYTPTSIETQASNAAGFSFSSDTITDKLTIMLTIFISALAVFYILRIIYLRKTNIISKSNKCSGCGKLVQQNIYCAYCGTKM